MSVIFGGVKKVTTSLRSFNYCVRHRDIVRPSEFIFKNDYKFYKHFIKSYEQTIETVYKDGENNWKKQY